MTSVFSWQNSVSLCLVSFCTLRPDLPVTPGISWLPTFAFQSPMMRRTPFCGVSLEHLLGLHRIAQLLWHLWLGHKLGLLGCWMAHLGNKLRSFCPFWNCTQIFEIAFQTLLLTVWFLCTVADVMVIWIKFPHSYPFISGFLRQWCSLLPSPVWPHPIHGPDIPGPYAILFFTT